ncbi:MAG TPA: glycosyl hydrolase family 28-related protein, partial [Thermoanaerobaculia bacterium]
MRRTLVALSFLLIAATAEARMKLQGYTNASATVTVYKAGTGTSATLFSTDTGTSKSNPFTAAADGFFSFYVDNGSYDIQFSGSFTTYSWTDIRVAEAGVTSNILTFGAKCDGSTDDTTAIQAAIDIATPNKVQLPTGTCKTTNELLIDDHRITIEGNGPDASYILFAPAASPKAAIRVDLASATVISLTRLKGFSIHTQDTTRLKIGIDIVDGSETIVEDVAIGTQDAWYGGTSVSPFTGTGSIGIRIAGREFGTFRNVRSCGAIPIYIANNPNFASIDLDHHNFDGFYLEPHGDNPSVYVEDGANLTNVVFQNGGWVLGGAGFYWPDTTSVGNSYDLIFRNIRAEQFTSPGYVFYITKSSPLRGLRIQDVLTGSGTNNKGVYLRGADQVVFDVFNYFGTLECLNTDSSFEWRNSVCQSTSTVNLGSLVEVWSEGHADSLAPIPMFGRWETAGAFTNFDAGLVRRYMGVYQLAKTGTLASSATQQIPSRFGSIVLGRISIAFKGATKNGSFTVAVTSAGAYLESTTDASITGVGNVA